MARVKDIKNINSANIVIYELHIYGFYRVIYTATMHLDPKKYVSSNIISFSYHN